MNRLSLVLQILLLMFPLASKAQEVKITLQNSTRLQRHQVVALQSDSISARLGLTVTASNLVIKDAAGVEVPYQLTRDGKLLLFASVRPLGQASFTIREGRATQFKSSVFVRQYPWRLDDLVIENDCSGYRFYGPSLQRKGERGFGIDVWLKNTSEMIVDSLYRMQQRGISFHLNHGLGMDCYNVGPSLGCGAPALIEADSLLFPWCYEKYEVLENGPLRLSVRLDFAPVAKGHYGIVTEHRLVVMERGSDFTQLTVWYDGLQAPATVAAGTVIHEADTHSIKLGRNYVSYADPTGNAEQQNCQIYVATLFPEKSCHTKRLMYKQPVNGIAGHAVGIWRNVQNNQQLTYWFGSAWSEYRVRSQAEWDLRIRQFLTEKKQPCIVKYE